MSTAGRGIAARVPSSWKMDGSNTSAAIPKQVKESTLNFNRYASIESGNLNLIVNNSSLQVALYDLNGNCVYQKRFTQSASLPLGEMAKARGTYIVRVTSGKTLLLSSQVGILR